MRYSRLLLSDSLRQPDKTIPIRETLLRDPGWEIRKIVTASEPKPGSSENKVAADEPKRKDLQSEVEAMKAENAAVRELLRKMEEQQKALLEQVDRLQRRLDGGVATDAVDR